MFTATLNKCAEEIIVKNLTIILYILYIYFFLILQTLDKGVITTVTITALSCDFYLYRGDS